MSFLLLLLLWLFLFVRLLVSVLAVWVVLPVVSGLIALLTSYAGLLVQQMIMRLGCGSVCQKKKSNLSTHKITVIMYHNVPIFHRNTMYSSSFVHRRR